MAKRIIWTENAKADLKDIVNYLKYRWSVQSAVKFTKQVYKVIDLIAVFPALGKTSEKDSEVRYILITKHNFLFYSVKEDELSILNIFEVAQNPNKKKYQQFLNKIRKLQITDNKTVEEFGKINFSC